MKDNKVASLYITFNLINYIYIYKRLCVKIYIKWCKRCFHWIVSCNKRDITNIDMEERQRSESKYNKIYLHVRKKVWVIGKVCGNMRISILILHIFLTYYVCVCVYIYIYIILLFYIILYCFIFLVSVLLLYIFCP